MVFYKNIKAKTPKEEMKFFIGVFYFKIKNYVNYSVKLLRFQQNCDKIMQKSHSIGICICLKNYKEVLLNVSTGII